MFVKATFDIACKWEGLPPVYRIYVNDELFTERTWPCDNCYLTEILQIQAPPGNYQVKLTTVEPTLAKFKIKNHQVPVGPGQWGFDNLLVITHENQ